MNNNQMYEYEEEIDLLKLILFVLSKWKSIIACVLAGAILGGAMAFFKPVAIPEQPMKEELSEIAELMLTMQERNVELAENQLDKITNDINDTKLMDVNPFEMYKGKLNIIVPTKEKNISYLYTALELYITDELYSDIEKELDYSLSDLSHIIFSSVAEQTDSLENKSIANITVYGKTETEAKEILESIKNAISVYLQSFTKQYYIPEYEFIESNVIVAENSNIAQYQKVMLVSSLGDAIKGSAAFIKTGLEEAEYIVSDCVNVIGRPDVIESAAEYDTAIVLEKTTKSNTKLVAEENEVIKMIRIS